VVTHLKESELDVKSGLLLGALSGCIFMIKLNFIVFVIGLLLPLLIEVIIRKGPKVCVRVTFAVIIGFIAALMPYALYAIITGSVDDFFTAYVVFNQKYTNFSGIGFAKVVANTLTQSANVFLSDSVRGFLLLFGMLYLLFDISNENHRHNISIVLSFLLLTLGINMSIMQPYANIPIMPFIMFSYSIV
jgi:hypothetical protein